MGDWRELTVAVGMLTALFACGYLTATEAENRETLVKSLGAATYAERQTAEEQLSQRSDEESQQLLEKLAVTHEDAEVRRRARRVLRSMAENALWRTTELTLPKQAPPSQTFNEIGRQTGIFMDMWTLGPPNNAGEVFFEKPGTFWEQLFEACRQSGNTPTYQVAHPGTTKPVVFISPQPWRCPTATCGPMAAFVIQMSRTRREEQFPIAGSVRQLQLYEFTVELWWEPQVNVLLVQETPKVAYGKTADGQLCSLSERYSTPVAAGVEHPSWRAVEANAGRYITDFEINVPTASMQPMVSMALEWSAIAASEQRELVVRGPAFIGEHSADDVIFDVLRFEAEESDDVFSTKSFYFEATVRRTLRLPQCNYPLATVLQLAAYDTNGRPVAFDDLQRDTAQDDGRMHMSGLISVPKDTDIGSLELSYPMLYSARRFIFCFPELPTSDIEKRQ